MKLRVKICGITNHDDALLCENLGAHALGFIFYKKSKRFIPVEKVKSISEQLNPFTLKVGVFVDELPKNINPAAKFAGLNLIQLHGNESPEFIRQIDRPVIKAFRVNSNFDFKKFNEFPECNFLLDSYSESQVGGTGKTFDWSLIPENIRHKIILSGGISSNNIEKILTEINPAAIDLASSIESEPGKKDKIKTEEFFNKLKDLNILC